MQTTLSALQAENQTILDGVTSRRRAIASARSHWERCVVKRDMLDYILANEQRHNELKKRIAALQFAMSA